MKPYPKYKDSGIEWIGEIPERWNAGKLKYSLVRNDGGAWGSDFDDNGTVVLRSTEINLYGSWQIDDPAKRLLSETDIDKTRLEVGDLLITKSSGSKKHIGKTALVNEMVANLKPCFSNFMQRIRPDTKSNSLYLHYILNSNLAREQYNYLSQTTTGLANLSAEIIGDIQIPYLPLLEQQAIADYLDEKTALIDELISKKQRQIELLTEQRQAVINQAVTKGLDPDVEMKDSGIEWLGEIPEHWDTLPLKRVSRIKYGLGQPPKEKENGLPLIRATNIERGRIISNNMIYVDPEDIPYEREPILKENDIIVVRSGAYTGDSAIIPKEYEGAITGYDLVVCVNDANPHYISYCLLSHCLLNNQINLCRLRAAQPHLNAEELGGILFFLPTKEEQSEIVAYLNDENNRIDNAISKAERQNQLLHEYRTALISEAVTGKIDVRDCLNTQ